MLTITWIFNIKYKFENILTDKKQNGYISFYNDIK